MNPSQIYTGSIPPQRQAPTPIMPSWQRKSRSDTPTILAVDDQHVVLELVDAFLEETDYRVYLAGGGQQALEICRRLEGPVDLLLTDVRMPGMNGPELHRRLAALYPDLKVLFMSGFKSDVAAHFGVPQDAPLVAKPFRPVALLARIREVLGNVPALSGAGRL